MEDRPAALAEMRRVVAPGGRVVVNTPGAIQPAFVAMEQAIVEHISPDLGGFVRAVFSMHDPDALATLLRDAGLRDVSATVTTATLELPAPAEFLWQYINLTPDGPVGCRGTRGSSVGHGTTGCRSLATLRRRWQDARRPADGHRVGSEVIHHEARVQR